MPHEETVVEQVDCSLFARYAGEDLDRWRTLVGGDVIHVDPRWGIGRVEDVRWGASDEHVASTIRIRTRYPEQGTVVFRAASFDVHHRSVGIPADVRHVIRVCFEDELPEARREAILERHTRRLREMRDRERIKRSEALRGRAIERKRRR